MKPSKFFSAIPLLLVGGLLLKMEIRGDEYCQGFVETMESVALIILYGSILLIISLISLFGSVKRKQPFNFFPVILTFVIIFAYIAIDCFQSEKFQSPPILFAIQNDHDRFESAKIELRQNNTFTITRKYIEVTCFNSGGFALNFDTLKLRNDIPVKTDLAFSSRYIIDTVAGYLYPLDFGDYLKDSSKWLVITDEDHVSDLNLKYQAIK